MGNKIIKIVYLILFFHCINTEYLEDCQVGNYCASEKYGCSIYGNCNFNIFEYFKENCTKEDKLPKCECNLGYSSYDIEVLKQDHTILCCYEKKGQLTAFLLEMFIGFGAGHFYIGNIKFGLIKLFVQTFLCFLFCCVTYFACNREHTFQARANEINNNEGKNILDENKNDNNENKGNENDENENNDDNDSNENKNDTKNQSIELDENKDDEIMMKNFIRCPKSMFVIYFSGISFLLLEVVDVILIGFGVYRDKNGEELLMWY